MNDDWPSLTTIMKMLFTFINDLQLITCYLHV